MIYVNYVKQYRFSTTTTDSKVEIYVEYTGEETPDLTVGETKYILANTTDYYDHGTKFRVKASTNDTEHYTIRTIIKMVEDQEIVINDANQDLVETTIECSTTKYNPSKLSAYTSKEFTLTNMCTIQVIAISEKYTLQVTQKVNPGAEAGILYEITAQDTYTKWLGNISYKTEGDFGYGTEVKIYILVSTPTVDQQNYMLGKITKDGIAVPITEQTVQDGTEYIITCKVEGDYVEGTQQIKSGLEMLFNALYYVSLSN